jgi:hypothetical protein
VHRIAGEIALKSPTPNLEKAEGGHKKGHSGRSHIPVRSRCVRGHVSLPTSVNAGGSTGAGAAAGLSPLTVNSSSGVRKRR